MRIGMITGASSGLGRAYAREIDKSMELDELWLIARRENRLKELAVSLRNKGRVLALDLTRRDNLEELRDRLQTERPIIDLLVCAAGFGKFGRAGDMSAEETHDMIALNCWGAVEATRLCLPYMERGGRILEVASCAGFQPLPGMNLYAATKAFLLHYTRALRRELSPSGINVTAVCPYWLKTEFFRVARSTARPDMVRHIRFPGRPEGMAAWSLAMNALNRPVVTGSPFPAAMRVGRKLLPTEFLMSAWDKIRR